MERTEPEQRQRMRSHAGPRDRKHWKPPEQRQIATGDSQNLSRKATENVAKV